MRIPKVQGVIRRRLLVNFRVDADVMQRLLPQPFTPKLQSGYAIAGICLIRLEQIRAKPLPRFLGVSSENAAHRIAVTWHEQNEAREGVFIPRRDTGSLLNRLAGGRIFPGEHNHARFDVAESADRIELKMRSADGQVSVDVSGQVATELPQSSVFRSVREASAFFEGGSLGYSVTAEGGRLDGVMLRTHDWRVEPLAIDHVHSSYFAAEKFFPRGSLTFDCALIMRNVEHEWHAAEDMYAERAG